MNKDFGSQLELIYHLWIDHQLTHDQIAQRYGYKIASVKGLITKAVKQHSKLKAVN